MFYLNPKEPNQIKRTVTKFATNGSYFLSFEKLKLTENQIDIQTFEIKFQKIHNLEFHIEKYLTL